MAALASANFAYGWGRGQGGGDCYSGPGYAGEIHAASALNLPAEQTEKIKALREAPSEGYQTPSEQDVQQAERTETALVADEPRPG